MINNQAALQKARLLGLITVLTMSSSLLYIVLYIIYAFKTAIYVNIVFIAGYSLTFALIKYSRINLALRWQFTVYMVHIFIYSSIIFTRQTGFHYYYLAIPSSIFLLSRYTNRFEQIFFGATSIVLFFICEFFISATPLIHLDPTANNVFFISAISLFQIGIIFVVYIFTDEIKRQESAQEKLISELRAASKEIRELQDIIPICSSCKKIRDDKGYWNLLETYLNQHADLSFSHGLCPDCSDEFYSGQEWYEKMKRNASDQSDTSHLNAE